MRADKSKNKSNRNTRARTARSMGLCLFIAGAVSSAAAVSGLKMYDSASMWTSTAVGMIHAAEIAIAAFAAASLMIILAVVLALITGIKSGRMPLLTMSFWLSVFLAICAGSNVRTVIAATNIMGSGGNDFTWESMETLYELGRVAAENRVFLLVMCAAGALTALYGLIRLLAGR